MRDFSAEDTDGIVECLNTDVTLNTTCATLFDPCRNICLQTYEIYLFDEMQRNQLTVTTYSKVYPVLMAVTIVANIFILVVLSKRHMRTSTNIVLMHMACADLAVAFVPFPFLFFWHVLGYGTRLKYRLRPWWCYTAMYTTDSMPPFCHNVAIWLTVLLALQRFVSIRYPMWVQFWRPATVNKFALLITFVSAVFSMPRFLDVEEYRTLKYRVRNANGTIVAEDYRCIFRPSKLSLMVGHDYYYSSYYWSRVILFVLIPSILLVIFSALLANELKKAGRRRRTLLKRRSTGSKIRNEKSSGTTLMLLVITVIFLIVNLPQGMVLSFFVLGQFFEALRLNTDVMLGVSVVDNMLILASYPINFGIYCCMSSAFRETLKQLFGCHTATFVSTIQETISRTPTRFAVKSSKSGMVESCVTPCETDAFL